MTCLVIGLGIGLLGIFYFLIGLFTLPIHGKDPYDPPFRYFSIGFMVFPALFILIGAIQVIFGNA